MEGEGSDFCRGWKLVSLQGHEHYLEQLRTAGQMMVDAKRDIEQRYPDGYWIDADTFVTSGKKEREAGGNNT